MHFPRIHKDEMRLFLFCAAAIIVVIGITTMITKYNSEGSVEGERLSEKEKSYIQELQKKVAKAEKNTFGPQYAPAQLAHDLFPFDPNHADSATLRKLGLSEWQTFNMMKYRRRGGRWRSPDDFKRLYGLSQADFERIRPYIRIAESDKRKPFVAFNERPYGQPVGEKPSYEKQEKLSEGTTVDINSADTTLLKKIPGHRQLLCTKNRELPRAVGRIYLRHTNRRDRRTTSWSLEMVHSRGTNERKETAHQPCRV